MPPDTLAGLGDEEDCAFRPLRTIVRELGCPSDFHAVNDWLVNFACQPNSQLNRVGAVCPCLVPAMETSRVLAARIDIPGQEVAHKRDHVATRVLALGAGFLQTSRFSDYSQDCLVVTVHPLLLHELRYVMDGVYLRLRPRFLSNKLIFGSFFEFSRRYSRLNASFLSMRTKQPFFAIRHMLKLDGRVLKDEPDYYPYYLLHYPPYE